MLRTLCHSCHIPSQNGWVCQVMMQTVPCRKQFVCSVSISMHWYCQGFLPIKIMIMNNQTLCTKVNPLILYWYRCVLCELRVYLFCFHPLHELFEFLAMHSYGAFSEKVWSQNLFRNRLLLWRSYVHTCICKGNITPSSTGIRLMKSRGRL